MIAIAVAAPDRTAAVAAATTEALAGRSSRVVTDAVAEARAALGSGAVPVETLARFRRARELIDEGWRAYLRVSFDVAADKLQAARAEAEPLVALPGGPELYADAALRLGAVLDRLRGRPDAYAPIALALALDPERPITLVEFSPDVVELVDAVRALPATSHRLTITTEPASARISLDHRDAAGSSFDVSRGEHLVVARAPRHHAAVRAITVTADSDLRLVLARDDAADRLAAGASPGMTEPAAEALVDATLRYADLDEVIIVVETTRRGDPALLVQRCAGAPARCTAPVELGFGDRSGLAAAARSAWDAVRTGELREPPTVLTTRGDRVIAGGRCRLCRNPWLWTGVGAAVLAGVVTLVVTSGSQPPPVVGIDGTRF